MTLPVEILPAQKQRVIDLIHAAGIGVSDWSNYKNGKTNPGANPKYCYEWALVEPGKLIVLNLWYDMMREVEGGVEQHLSLHDPAAQQERNATRRARRNRMEAAISLAHQTHLPIRVIVLGGKSKATVDGSRATLVGARILDPVAWGVTSFNQRTGKIVLRRGLSSTSYTDQFSLPPHGATGKREVAGTVYERSAEVRRYVLARAKGNCEFCNAKGFELLNGGLYLETHHAVPLSEGGKDSVSNVVALCPNHHREAHYGEREGEIRRELLKLLATPRAC
jgi:5-methylcytosine-specific restriction enzyme A